jgi:hypothetical protein
MNDILSLILDIIIFMVFFLTRLGAVWYGIIGIATHQIEFIATGILIYLVSNTFEKILEERLGKCKNG